MQNPVAYRAIRMIAEGCASLPFTLFEGRRELDTHPLLDLLARPNPAETGRDLIESLAASLQIAGNAYIEAISIDAAPRELYALRPDRVRIVPGPNGWPQAYLYAAAGRETRIGPDTEGFLPVLHLKLFHPADDHYGLSPLEAAHRAIDLHNAAAAWGRALLDNAARPSGALIYKGPEGQTHLTAEQFARLRAELDEQFAGSRNAGRALLLEGGLDWRPMGLTPADMDFIRGREAAARDIAMAFGVPPMLLGIPGDATYANYAAAQAAFWRMTVLPLAQKIAQGLTNWLGPRFGEALTLKVDPDGIDALAPERDALWSRLNQALFLSRNEKREAAGYGALPGGDAPEETL